MLRVGAVVIPLSRRSENWALLLVESEGLNLAHLAEADLGILSGVEGLVVVFFIYLVLNYRKSFTLLRLEGPISR